MRCLGRPRKGFLKFSCVPESKKKEIIGHWSFDIYHLLMIPAPSIVLVPLFFAPTIPVSLYSSPFLTLRIVTTAHRDNQVAGGAADYS